MRKSSIRNERSTSGGSTVFGDVMEKIGQHLMEPGLKNRLYCLAWACPNRNWLIRKYETFSLVNSWCLRNKVKLACHLLSIMHVLFSTPHSLSSSSLILGGQIVHINKVKGKLALFSTKDNVLLTPHPSYSFTINSFSPLEDISYIPDSETSLRRPLYSVPMKVAGAEGSTVYSIYCKALLFTI